MEKPPKKKMKYSKWLNYIARQSVKNASMGKPEDGKSNFFSEGIFLYRGFSLLQSEHPLFCIFLDWFSKYFLLKLKLFRHNTYYNRNLLEIPKKIGKKVGIHFYENILSEKNLPLICWRRRFEHYCLPRWHFRHFLEMGCSYCFRIYSCLLEVSLNMEQS